MKSIFLECDEYTIKTKKETTESRHVKIKHFTSTHCFDILKLCIFLKGVMKVRCHPWLDLMKLILLSLVACFLGCAKLYASDINWDEISKCESQGISPTVKREIKRQIHKSYGSYYATHSAILETLTHKDPYLDENAEFVGVYKGLARTLFERAMQFLTGIKKPGSTLQDIKASLGTHLSLSKYSFETYDSLTDAVGLKDMVATSFPIFLMPVSDFIHSFFIHPAAHYYNAAMQYATDFEQSIIVTDRLWIEKAFELYYPNWIPLEARKSKKKSIFSNLVKKN